MKTKQKTETWHIGMRRPESKIFIYAHDGTEIANCDLYMNLRDKNLAHARLIAAAPELIAALEDCLAPLQDAQNQLQHRAAAAAFINARAAIAKAKGESHA